MLQIRNIFKKFVTGDLTQTALDGVSLNLRDSEFVAILGPSGSGKTTLLNVIGGLDRYDSGNLIIDGVSTKKYKDRDWDSYRNHTIGFVFQSYNLIAHQSVLSNVELALTISGVSRRERRVRARRALTAVGLGNQLHKRPNQMSGGQMQRVAIARALVNNPAILLADEPTGALDSDTSVQVMELLKEVAKKRLVVMVTHNPELAQQYATRIVRLRDGKIISDTDPFIPDPATVKRPVHRRLGKASMAFLTALSLSFNNLRTKMGRTLLTSFAGSIGIIGIALILSISTGVNNYITDIQKNTMTSYPITIDAKTFDLSSVLTAGKATTEKAKGEADHPLDGVYSDPSMLTMASSVSMSLTENNLTEFKKYLDDEDSEIRQYLGENGITYSYDTRFSVYSYDPEGTLVNTDGSTVTPKSGIYSGMSMSMMGQSTGNLNFTELLPGQNGELVSNAVKENYTVEGRLPEKWDEVVLLLDRHNEISSLSLYQLGILPVSEYKELVDKISAGEEISDEQIRFDYDDIIGFEFLLIPNCDLYKKAESGFFYSVEDEDGGIESIIDSAMKLKIVGIMKPIEDSNYDVMTAPIGYTKALSDKIIEYTDNSEVVKAQKESKDRSVINGALFAPDGDAEKIADAKEYFSKLSTAEKAEAGRAMMTAMYAGNEQMSGAILAMSDNDLASAFDSFMADEENNSEMILSIYDKYISVGTYEDNMTAFGLVSVDAPSSISIYTDSFENKDRIAECIEQYNESADEEDKITYTDYVGLLMSSVTTIVNVVSYVLIAFVSVSLVVSSIMIGIITYISVLERTKEIGILRAIGASKRNISQVFNAETLIIGICAGIIGVGVTLLILIPGNILIHSLTGTNDVNAVLPAGAAVILVALSMVLTLIGGIIPSRKAAKKDPVTALRTE